MRIPLVIVVLLSAALSPALAQQLVCPPVAAVAGRPCDLFHYHVLAFRPDSRGFIELYGINQFASQSACDRARDEQFKRNMAVVEFFHSQRHADWWQPDKFGACHCDRTVEKASPNLLSEAARWSQVQLANEIRQRVRERLLDAGVPSDGELIRGLSPPPAAAPLIGGPRLVQVPAAPTSTILNSPDDLRITRTVNTTASPASSLDLPLADIPLPGITQVLPGATGTDTSQTVVPQAPSPASTAPVAPTQAQPVPAQPQLQPKPTPAPAESVPAPTPGTMPPSLEPTVVVAEEPDLPEPEDVADAFISYESQRIQNVLKVSGTIGDEAVKAQVLDACTQRIQLLSNLRSIIVGSGAKSRLVAAASSAKKESERLAVVSKLFGTDVPPHWAPKDAEDVVFDPAVADPERVLRDDAAPLEQRRHALYALLATSAPTEQQQLWLSSVIEAFLQ